MHRIGAHLAVHKRSRAHMPRAENQGELESHWPRDHWDHWMRSETVHKTSRGRECLIPQLPRAFHHGVVGTFMEPQMHESFFAHINLNTDPRICWPPAEWPSIRAAVVLHAYEARLRATIRASRPLLDDLGELLRSPSAPGGGHATAGDVAVQAPLALWYDVAPRDGTSLLFKEIASFIGTWHEARRAQHNGVHELWCQGRQLLLINLRVGAEGRPSPYGDLAPPGSGPSPCRHQAPGRPPCTYLQQAHVADQHHRRVDTERKGAVFRSATVRDRELCRLGFVSYR